MNTESLPRTDWLSAVDLSCAVCHGTGWRSEGSVCLCVWRGVFRDVYGRFKYCAESGYHKPISLDGTSGPQGRRTGYGIRHAEFMADFCLIAKRTLTPLEHTMFKYHFLLGADWKLCGQKMGLNKGQCFKVIYRLTQKLGRTFATLEPYGLYPVDVYLSGSTRHPDIRPFPARDDAPRYHPLRPPLRAPAPVPVATVPVLRALEPVPMVPLDPADVPGQVRAWWSAGVSARACAARLNRWNVPSTRGSKWYTSDIWRLLIDAPREPAPAKLAA